MTLAAVHRTEGLEAVLDRIDHTLTLTLDALADDWAQITGGRAADVLGGRDVPQLLREASRGGKRVRPTAVYWGWVAAGGHRRTQVDDVVRAGAALELLHVFALIHDDVMDRSEIRRGRPATHAIAREAHRRAGGLGEARDFGDSIAILVGDLAHAEADHLVAPLSASVRRVWRLMMIELVLGQRRDLTGAALRRRDLDHALEVSRLKTGTYTVERPLELGAMIAGADRGAMAALLTYGRHVGEAFGLRDDLLGTWGEPDQTGKPNGDDLTAGKATVLLALADGCLPAEGRRLLARAGADDLRPAELQRLRSEMAACGVREQAEDLIRGEIEAACHALDPRWLSSAGIAGLTRLAEQVAWREA